MLLYYNSFPGYWAPSLYTDLYAFYPRGRIRKPNVAPVLFARQIRGRMDRHPQVLFVVRYAIPSNTPGHKDQKRNFRVGFRFLGCALEQMTSYGRLPHTWQRPQICLNQIADALRNLGDTKLVGAVNRGRRRRLVDQSVVSVGCTCQISCAAPKLNHGRHAASKVPLVTWPPIMATISENLKECNLCGARNGQDARLKYSWPSNLPRLVG
jgi:hypothetical protein